MTQEKKQIQPEVIISELQARVAWLESRTLTIHQALYEAEKEILAAKTKIESEREAHIKVQLGYQSQLSEANGHISRLQATNGAEGRKAEYPDEPWSDDEHGAITG